MNYSKHPPKSSIQEFGKTTFPTFGPSGCDKRFCSISLKYTTNIFPKHPQKTPIQESLKTTFTTFGPSGCYKRFCSISPKHIIQNIPKKHPSKNSTKQPSPLLDHFLYFLPIYKSAA